MKKIRVVKKILLIAIMLMFAIPEYSGSKMLYIKADSMGVQDIFSNSESSAYVYAENGLPKNKIVTLKVGFPETGNGRAWYDYCVKMFCDRFPNVRIVTEYSSNIGEIVKKKVCASNDEDMFDCWYSNWAELAQSGKLEPLNDLWERNLYDNPGVKVKDMIMPGTFENLPKHEGNIYLVSGNEYICGVFFDKKFFIENGWNDDPRTWDEFLKLCENIKSKNIAPIIYPGKYSDYLELAFFAKPFELAENYGNNEFAVKWKKAEGPQFTTKEMIEKWNKIYELGKRNCFYPKLIDLTHIQAQELVIDHKAAMVISGDWISEEMKDKVPDNFDWGFMSIPFTNNKDATIYIRKGINNHFIVWKSKPELNKRWTKEFLLWLLNLDCQKALVDMGGAMPLRKDYFSVYEKVNLRNSQKAILDYISKHNIKFVSNTRDNTYISYNISMAFKLIEDKVISISLGQTEPEPILKSSEDLLQNTMAIIRR